MNYLKQRIGRILSELDRRVVMDRQRVEGITMCECDYKNGANMPPKVSPQPNSRHAASAGGIFAPFL